MQGRLLCGVAATLATLAVFTGGASASGPAPPGKQLIELNCEGIGPVTVSIPRGRSHSSAGQIVGEKGHGIPVASTFTVTDLSIPAVLNTESTVVGGGHAHPNQAATTCSGVVFSGTASEFFGEGPLPPEVLAADTIEATIEVDVILK
jgi:hypothetical protein